jgi:EAL domain-containing protein (putative c-di-GMP-specific phosphodiesterase class I)
MAECMQEEVIRDIIRSTSILGIKRDRFCLELTETASAYLPAVAKNNLQKLASAGFHLYLDDFGQGQANLDHLIMLPFSVVKLDRSFVINPMGEKLRANTISLVKRLGMKALIEGVETKEEAEAVIADGVDYIQGFYYSKPLSKDQFLAFLRAHTFD